MWNMFKVNHKDIKTTSITSFWCLYCLLCTYFTPFSVDSIVDFRHVFISWEKSVVNIALYWGSFEWMLTWTRNINMGTWKRNLSVLRYSAANHLLAWPSRHFSKSMIKTLEQCMNTIQSQHWIHQNNITD